MERILALQKMSDFKQKEHFCWIALKAIIALPTATRLVRQLATSARAPAALLSWNGKGRQVFPALDVIVWLFTEFRRSKLSDLKQWREKMERILRLQKLAEPLYYGEAIMATSHQSNHCSSESIGCSSVSNDCTPHTQLTEAEW